MKVGLLFGENIKTEKIDKRHRSYDLHVGSTRIREYILPLFLFLLTVILFSRLVYIQIIKGSYYRLLSDSNRTKTTILHAPRGIIFDRNKTPLVYNTPGFREIVKGKTQQITRDLANMLIASGKDLEVDSLRKYPFKELAAHALGYIGQISEDELRLDKFKTYRATDLVGRSGIEEFYEERLRGIDGKELVEVDAMGKTVRAIGKTEGIPGEDIVVTLDAKLQTAAYESLESKKGAVVVSTPTGEILALVSKPSFDPNLFTFDNLVQEQGSASAYTSIDQILLDSDNQPLLNRAVSGTYPPGSTFKLVNVVAGLENNVIDEKFEITDTGILHLGAFSFANWYFTQYGKTEGEVNVVKAIKRSNDIFFYKLAELVGVDRLSETAAQFGLGKKLGIDLDGEAEGTLPTTEWKKKVIGEQWYLGDTYHYGIGQGYLLTTPLQVNGWTQAIANGGTLYRPHLLKNQKLEVLSQKLMSSKTFELIREGMVESCSLGGVAWPLFKLKIKNEKLKIDQKNFLEVPESTASAQFKDYREITIACKTGTAQHGGEKTLSHAWITLFAPAYNPQIVVTVLAESSGEGSNIAAPVAKKILEEWFSR